MEDQKKNNIFRILRLCMGLNLKEMAEKCKISAIYLNELERGKKENPSDQILEKIASACGLKVSTLQIFVGKSQGEAPEYQRYLLRALDDYAADMRTQFTGDSSGDIPGHGSAASSAPPQGDSQALVDGRQ